MNKAAVQNISLLFAKIGSLCTKLLLKQKSGDGREGDVTAVTIL